jgi:hypothetical protein
MRALPVLLLGGALIAPGTAAAQRVGALVRPDTITVGDPAVVAVRVQLPAGYQAVFPDTLDISGDLENTGPRRVLEDAAADGSRAYTALYPVTAWRPGAQALPVIPVVVLGPDGEPLSIEATAPPLNVASVLPADTAGIEPRPAKDVIGGGRGWGALVALAAALLALAALLAWWLRRRRQAAPGSAAPGAPPREVAFATLKRARLGGFVESGLYKVFYTLIGDALRHYQAALDARWGADLTTGELLGRMRADRDVPDLAPLEQVLQRADMVKFARGTVSEQQAWEDWSAAYAWVAGFDWPPPAVAEAEPPLQEVA